MGGGKRRELEVADESVPEIENEFFVWDLAYEGVDRHTNTEKKGNELEFFERELYSSYGKKGKGKGGKKGKYYYNSYSYGKKGKGGKKRRELEVADESVPEIENEFFVWDLAYEGVDRHTNTEKKGNE